MSNAISINVALSLDTAGVKWPFSPQRPGARKPAGAESGRAATPLSIAPTAKPVSQTPKHVAETVGVSTSARVTGIACDANVMPGIGASTGVFSQTSIVTRRQMITDVVLVAVWGGIIPLVLWLGHAAGF